MLAKGKENSVLVAAETELYQKMMHNATCRIIVKHCETIDLSQNSLADGEDQLLVIRGAFLVFLFLELLKTLYGFHGWLLVSDWL